MILEEPCTTNFLEASHKMLDALILCNHPRKFHHETMDDYMCQNTVQF